MPSFIRLSSLMVLVASVTGCSSLTKGLGVTRQAPNEFNILTKAPLSVPPEYNLRPPQIGQSNLENNYSQEAARIALIGDIDAAEPSPGEVVLMSKAGVGQADQEIRLVIDGQNNVERKTSDFVDSVLFWHDGQIVQPDGSPLDPEIEARRLRSIETATGGGEVTITRRPGRAKLPGL